MLFCEQQYKFYAIALWNRSLHNSLWEMAISATVIAFAILIPIFFWLLSRVFRGVKKNKARLPPGPSPWPIIGNLHQLGKNPHHRLQKLADQYGSIMFLRLGSAPTVVASSSEAAKEFLQTHDMIFATRPASAYGKYIFYNYKNVVRSPYGPYWRNMRKICVLELLTSKRIESFKSVREEEVSLMIRSITKKSGEGKVAVDVSKAISSFTVDTTWRVIAGRKYTDDDLAGSGRGSRSGIGISIGFKELFEEIAVLGGAFNIGDFLPYLDWLDLQGFKRRMKKANKLFDGFAEKIIDEHVEGRRKLTKVINKDLVDVLLDTNNADIQITRQERKAIIIDMYAAGMETSKTTLEWAMSELLRNPHSLKNLQDEIECVIGKDRTLSEADLGRMEYLHCVVKETLRLHPAAPLLVPHESTQACTVKGPDRSYFVPTKTRLIVNAWAIGRDATVWEDPLVFNPERFMGMNFDAIKDKDMRMLPFGAGRRGCPGASMGLATVNIALAQLVHCFDWKLEGDPYHLDMTEVFGVTTRRKNHLFAIPTFRLKVPSSLVIE